MNPRFFPFTPSYQIKLGDNHYRCSLGKNGVSENKKEGDGTTPAGEFYLRRLFYRGDRIPNEIKTNLPIQRLTKKDGWCDDVKFPEYNTFIHLPFSGSHEELWREDHLYDLIIVVGYNDHPVEKNKGSAIFIHIARENYQPTAGCIALKKEDLLAILPFLSVDTSINISMNGDLVLNNNEKKLSLKK